MKTNGSESKNKWCFSCPQRVDSLDMHGVVSVSANGDHSAALTRELNLSVSLMLRLVSDNEMLSTDVMCNCAFLWCGIKWKLMILFLLASIIVGTMCGVVIKLVLYSPIISVG